MELLTLFTGIAAISLLALAIYLPWAFGVLHGEARVARRHREFLMEELSKFATDFSKARINFSEIARDTSEMNHKIDNWQDRMDAALTEMIEHLAKREPQLMHIPAPETPAHRESPTPFENGESIYKALKLMGDRVRAAEADKERAINIAKALKDKLDAQSQPVVYPEPEVFTAPADPEATVTFDEAKRGMTSPFDDILRAANPKDDE